MADKVAQVAIIMGSQSDLVIMQEAALILEELQLMSDVTIVSAHRTPIRMIEFAQSAREKGYKVIIAGAGGAAHLPGMVASLTSLPVIGVPVKSSNSIDGWDSLLSIVQMPGGVPVATVAVNGAKNAGILAAQIIGATDLEVAKRLDEYKERLRLSVMEQTQTLEKHGWKKKNIGF
jgi:5-(carboxyamino)imidazole ribonucleotide mutase